MNGTAPKSKILLVDDDSFLIALYQKKGEEVGVELRTALSGQEALTILNQGFVPEVVALDMSMAGMSGLDVLKEIRDKKLIPNAKIIFLSNTSEDSTVAEAKTLGATKFIVKASLLPSQVMEELLKAAKG